MRGGGLHEPKDYNPTHWVQYIKNTLQWIGKVLFFKICIQYRKKSVEMAENECTTDSQASHVFLTLIVTIQILQNKNINIQGRTICSADWIGSKN